MVYLPESRASASETGATFGTTPSSLTAGFALGQGPQSEGVPACEPAPASSSPARRRLPLRVWEACCPRSHGEGACLSLPPDRPHRLFWGKSKFVISTSSLLVKLLSGKERAKLVGVQAHVIEQMMRGFPLIVEKRGAGENEVLGPAWPCHELSVYLGKSSNL